MQPARMPSQGVAAPKEASRHGFAGGFCHFARSATPHHRQVRAGAGLGKPSASAAGLGYNGAPLRQEFAMILSLSSVIVRFGSNAARVGARTRIVRRWAS
ncbi:hypothetical protein GCM10027419_20740 [Pandoraea terrae]